MQATFYGIGVGPGDPDLLTIKATKILANVDIILLPEAKKNAGSVAWQIAQPYLQANIEQRTFVFPMTADPAQLASIHQEHAQALLPHLQQGKNIAMLTLGDPMLYSTYSYLAQALQQLGAKVESIAGIYSFALASNQLHLPLVQGNEKLAVVADFTPETQQHISQFDSVVCMKVSAYYQQLKHFLDQHPQWQFNLVTNAGKPNQIMSTNTEILNEKPHYFSTAILRKNKTTDSST